MSIPAVPSRPYVSLLLTSALERRHWCCARKQMVPEGQQYRPPIQQTESGPYGQHLKNGGPVRRRQHLLPAGQEEPSGHRTCNLSYGFTINIHLITIMDLTLGKSQNLLTCSIFEQFTIQALIFPPQILQRFILATCLQNKFKMEQRICLTGIQSVLLKVLIDRALNTSCQIARGLCTYQLKPCSPLKGKQQTHFVR